MSNIDTVAGIYENFGKGNIPAILDVLSDDVRWESWEQNSAAEAGVPWMQPRNGKDAVIGFFEAAAQMEVVDLQILSFMEGGDKVAVEFVFEANLPTFGGGHYRDEELHLWTFDEAGKVIGLRHYTDTARQIAAYGAAR